MADTQDGGVNGKVCVAGYIAGYTPWVYQALFGRSLHPDHSNAQSDQAAAKQN
jgi:hypothetical protein